MKDIEITTSETGPNVSPMLFTEMKELSLTGPGQAVG